MSGRDALYSRFVFWLKIILPLAALGLLSTLFLLSRQVNTTPTIPFSQSDLQDRTRDQQITAPSFAGTTPEGDLITLTAQSARPVLGENGQLTLQTLDMRMQMSAGGEISLRADSGVLTQSDEAVRLSGSVRITSAAGYDIRTDTLEGGLRALWLRAPDGIEAEGPPGQLRAGAMRLDSDPQTRDVMMVFDRGVTLTYRPPN